MKHTKQEIIEAAKKCFIILEPYINESMFYRYNDDTYLKSVPEKVQALELRDYSRKQFEQLGKKYELESTNASVQMASSKWSGVAGCGELSFLILPLLFKHLKLESIERGLAWSAICKNINHAFLIIKTDKNEELVIDPFLRKVIPYKDYFKDRDFWFLLGLTIVPDDLSQKQLIGGARQQISLTEEGMQRVNQEIKKLMDDSKNIKKEIKTHHPCKFDKENSFAEKVHQKLSDVHIELFFKTPTYKQQTLDDFIINAHITAQNNESYKNLVTFFSPTKMKSVKVIEVPEEQKIIVCDINTPEHEKSEVLYSI